MIGEDGKGRIIPKCRWSMNNCAEKFAAQPFEWLLQTTSDAAFIIDLNTRRILACNQVAERVFSCPAAEMIGRSTEILHVNAAAFQRAAVNTRRAFEQGGIYATNYAMRRQGGDVFTARIRIIPMTTPGHMDLALSLIRDESRLSVQGERLQRDLAQIATAVGSIVSKWTMIIERIADEFGWDYGECWSPRNGRLVMKTHWSAGQSGIGRFVETRCSQRLKLGENLLGRVWKTLKEEWLPDCDKETEARGRRATDKKSVLFRSWFVLPVIDDCNSIIVLAFSSRTARQPDEIVMNLSRRAVRGVTHLLRTNNGGKPRLEDQRFASLVAVHPLPIWVCDARNIRIFDANDAALTVSGHNRDELEGKKYTELLDSIGADSIYCHLPVIDTEHSTKRIGKVMIVGKNGSSVDLYLEMFPVTWRHHDAIAIVGVKTPNLAPWLIDGRPSTEALEGRLKALTPREKQVLDLLMEGNSNKEIGQVLKISSRTVEIYRAAMMRKMEAKSAMHLLSMLAFNEHL